MIDYPQKGSHYAHKTFRLMHKAMVAADYGRDVFCLLSIILHTEDAARYRGPVSYYNTQLMETLGFKKWEQFDAVRAKAIASGWLQYEGCGKRTPGKYFVTIPEGFEQVDDGLMEECISPENGYKRGYDEGYKLGYDAGVKQGIEWGINSAQTGGQTGGTSYPIPTPDPNPTPSPTNTPPNPQGGTLAVEQKTKSKGRKKDIDPDCDGSNVTFPPEMNTPEICEAWRAWCEYRRKFAPWNDGTASIQAKRLAKIGPEEAVDSIEIAIASGWACMFPISKQRPTKPTPPDYHQIFLDKLEQARPSRNQ